MQKSLFYGYLAVGIALSCSIAVVSAKAASIPQAVAQRTQEQILISQSTVDEKINLKFESRGCSRTKTTQVTCDVLITNLGNTRQIVKFTSDYQYMPETNAIDSSGTVYPVQISQSGADISKYSGGYDRLDCNCFSISLVSGIPTKVTFTFEIPQEVNELAAIDLGFAWANGVGYDTENKRIAISNIGAIVPQSNSAPPRQRVR